MIDPDSKPPLASICVPTYNGAAYFRECLASIHAQTLGDFEVLIVDDESTDDTLAIAAEFARRDQRFQIHRNPKRLGLVGNWNRSLELARGEWIKFVFQDDTIENRCLERLVAACRHYQCAFGFCRRQVVFDELASDTLRNYFQAHQVTLDEIYGLKDCHLAGETFARRAVERMDWNPVGEPTAVLFQRSLIKDFGKFVPAMIQRCDTEYWLRLGANVGVVQVAERLATFRVHDKSTTSQNQSKRDYRARLIDPLILHYLILHEKHYQVLRRELYRSSGRLVNWWRLVWAAQQARTVAAASANFPEIQAEWKNVVVAYPKLSALARVGGVLNQIRSTLGVLGLNRRLKKKTSA
jgi:glycosyltransferase involved in cell wall biosynthesis